MKNKPILTVKLLINELILILGSLPKMLQFSLQQFSFLDNQMESASL
jgi:hypothetical protein